MATGIQILDKAICISHSTSILGKDTQPTIILPVMSRADLGLATDLGERKL